MVLEQTWRWFGPEDRVTLRDAREAGATGIVNALHEIPVGEVWPIETIRKRQEMVRFSGMEWTVVESLGVTERIKMRAPGWQKDMENFIQSIRHLAKCGIRTIAYNWMPLFSWTRTHLHESAPGGGYTTRFDAVAFAAFDLYMLKRTGADKEWGEDLSREAFRYCKALSLEQADELRATILDGLPGGHKKLTLEETAEMLRSYEGITADELRSSLGEFLRTVAPVAEECGVRLCIHPDDPPRPLLGLPRIVSTAEDLRWILEQYAGDANSLTFCTGALGVRADNKLREMVTEFAPRIGFLHLRSTERESRANSDIESFFEAPHLEGDADLISIIIEVVREKHRRNSCGDSRSLPYRADHGQELLNDRERGAAPGYPAVGRLRGLAELRGAFMMAERWITEG
ncbi:mannonate dehydratase [Terriglobus roseus]|uniref:Mannonate dehydratase n=1 Tax=Terriglobus roseus TaxID=392734 RepID=A0A1G7NSU3_9BACT|nr:mannonate dehydratase [Terriglobus roseus]SDF77102.1 mannonate dehydratase [Terriglobus roseus]